jgi:hypothetical protein
MERRNVAERGNITSTFSMKLRQLLWSEPLASLMGERNGTWLAGQCWTLAEGLLRYWREEEQLHEPFLAPYDEQLLMQSGIVRDGRTSRQLTDSFFNEAYKRTKVLVDQRSEAC